VLACAAPAVVAAGADCTPIAAFARCPEGEGCAEARCRPATPPTLIDAAAAVDPAAAVFGLAVEARDAEADVVAARVVLLDAHGDALLAQALRIDLAIRADAQGLLGRGGGVLPEALARPGDVASAEIRAVDATGGESAPLRVPVRRPEPAFEGGGCDPLEAFDRCPEGLACVHVDGDPLARAFCAAPTPECPEAWAVATVDAAAAPPWQAEAPPGDPLTTPGQCGGSAPGHAVVFVAPSAGRYRVRLLDAPPEAVVVGRRLCALTTPRFEVGCGADWTVPLSAGASLALLVASPEAVTLEITPEAP
jgi:hypothetical protein